MYAEYLQTYYSYIFCKLIFPTYNHTALELLMLIWNQVTEASNWKNRIAYTVVMDESNLNITAYKVELIFTL